MVHIGGEFILAVAKTRAAISSQRVEIETVILTSQWCPKVVYFEMFCGFGMVCVWEVDDKTPYFVIWKKVILNGMQTSKRLEIE